MSYGFGLYHRSVRQTADAGRELDEFEHPPLHEEAVRQFISGLASYGYKPESTTPERRAFVKRVGSCPIQVAIYSTEIAFSIPYWEGSEDAIFEALQDASELADSEHMALFNPQAGEWADA